jgi:choline dehydrogenase-like flavoprotein
VRATARTPLAEDPLLTDAQRATLAAVARRVLDGAAELAPALDVAAVVEARLARMPEDKRADLRTVLALFGSRAAALVTVGVPVPFARLDAARQDRMLAAWGRSRVPIQRTVHQALRRLALAAWWAVPEVQGAVGHLGPLYPRGPALPWEGPPPGETRDDEPIARGAWPGDAAGVRSLALPIARDAPARGAIVPGAHLSGDVRLAADAVVIGSGAGGAVAAARLAEAGLEVVILEEGSLHTSRDFDEVEGRAAERLYAEQAMRATDDLAVSLFQGSTVGGSTTVNWMLMLRPEDHVLDEWARRFGLAELAPPRLAPVLDEIEREVHARAVPGDAHSPANRILLDGARALGWRARGVSINARGCVRAGHCGHGCRYDAKQGTLLTYVPRALARGATVYANARARRVETIERDAGALRQRRPPRRRVVADVTDGAGAPRGTLTVEAPLVFVAGGAVGTPALLQRSGLGGGGVGRWLRLHPTTAVTGVYDRPVHAGAGIPMSTICDEFSAAGPGGYGFWIECPPWHPMIAAVAASGFGRAHAAVAREYARTAPLIALVRDGAPDGAPDGGDADRSSGEVTVDRRGRTRVRYRLSPADARQMARGIEAAARLHLAAGAREARTLHAEPAVARAERDLAALAARSLAPNDVSVFSAHVNGTCRLGVDPRASGCAPDGQRHGARGVHVCDGSLLPTGLGVNPQETIMALATVVARGALAAW